jgi:hypothetical protein
MMMNKMQSRLILTSMALGAILGLGIGVVVAETKKEQLQLAEVYGEDKVVVQPGFREWIAVSIAAITLIRQLSNILTPKV